MRAPLLLVALASTTLGCAGTKKGTGRPGSDAPLRFEVVTETPTFSAEWPHLPDVNMTARLTNVSAQPIVVAAKHAGNVALVSATADGVPLPEVAFDVAFGFSPFAGMERSIKRLQPNESVTFPLAGLKTFVDNSSYRTFATRGPGEYRIRFAYEATVARRFDSALYLGKVLSNEVVFNVTK